jgi:uncharacterized membrane protein
VTAVIAVLVFVPVGVLSVLPVTFVWIGLGALGARLGLWTGEPTVNDGEEYWAWPIGLAALLVLIGVGVLIARRVVRLVIRSLDRLSARAAVRSTVRRR